MRVFSVLAVCAIGICLMLGANLSTLPALASTTEATVNIHPKTLNLKSGGKWITAHIELPKPFNVSDIDISTILLDGIIGAESNPKYGFVKDPETIDRDNNGVAELMVKFDKYAVIDHVWVRLYHMGIGPPHKIEFTITGSLLDGTTFEGKDTINVINP